MLKKYIEKLNVLQKRMSSSRYRTSKERMDILSSMISDGKRAETLIDFSKELLSDIQEEVLAKLKEPEANLKEIQGYYMGSLAFVDKLQEVINNGKSKQEKLREIKEKLKEE